MRGQVAHHTDCETFIDMWRCDFAPAPRRREAIPEHKHNIIYAYYFWERLSVRVTRRNSLAIGSANSWWKSVCYDAHRWTSGRRRGWLPLPNM